MDQRPSFLKNRFPDGAQRAHPCEAQLICWAQADEQLQLGLATPSAIPKRDNEDSLSFGLVHVVEKALALG
jgi:hypothetical protein